MDQIFRDVRYGVRSLIKSPGLTLVATVALTLGIGLTATMFSIVYGALMKGLPFPDGERIVEVVRSNPSRNQQRMSVPMSDFEDFRQQQKSLDQLSAYYGGTVNVSGTGDPERYDGAFVSATALDITRVRPLHGRTFKPGDDAPNGPRVALIGFSLWQQRYGGDTSVIGSTIRANGQPFTIVGVMPEHFMFPGNAAIWLPLPLDPLALKRGEGQGLTVVGMLKPGVTVGQATRDFNAIAKRLAADYKETNEGIEAAVLPYVEAELGPEPRQLLYTMLGAVFFVLLIACANVANLLLDRAAHKTKEVGIRTALGASRSAVVRQFLSEAFVLSAAGAVFGTALAQGAITVFNRVLVDTQPPFFIDIKLHPPVLAFVIAVAAVATLFSGAIPAFQASRIDINEVLKDESRGSSSLHIGRMSKGLVVFEIALSCGLLVASGLMIKSVTNLQSMDPGFRTANIFTARIGFPAGYTDTLAQRQMFEQLRARLVAIPGARNAAIMSTLPGVGSNGGSFTVDGATYATEREIPNCSWHVVSDGYFETFGVTVQQGRGILNSDRSDGDQIAVVNRAFAEKYFPGKDPLGHRIRPGTTTSQLPWMTIVGIVPTAFTGDPNHAREPAYYAPLSQHHSNFVSIAVAMAGPPMSITSQVRAAVASLNADIPLYRIYSMEEAVARPTWYIRVFGTMFMAFGLIALFLASVGLYAVMSFSVSRRRREMGIRMALGARSGDVVALIMKQGVGQIGIGMALGLGLAATMAQLMTVVLFQVEPRDPAIFGGVVVVLATTGMIACLVPARRATRVDPQVALRTE